MKDKQEHSFDKRDGRNGGNRAKWTLLIVLMLAAVLAFPLAANAMANGGTKDAAAATAAPNEPAEDPSEDSADDSANEAVENAALAAAVKLTADDAVKALIDAGILTADEAAGVTPSLESENGRAVYAVPVGQTEYKVDAMTGEVIADSEADVEYEG